VLIGLAWCPSVPLHYALFATCDRLESRPRCHAAGNHLSIAARRQLPRTPMPLSPSKSLVCGSTGAGWYCLDSHSSADGLADFSEGAHSRLFVCPAMQGLLKEFDGAVVCVLEG
jgi:hypothetical protein